MTVIIEFGKSLKKLLLHLDLKLIRSFKAIQPILKLHDFLLKI